MVLWSNKVIFGGSSLTICQQVPFGICYVVSCQLKQDAGSSLRFDYLLKTSMTLTNLLKLYEEHYLWNYSLSIGWYRILWEDNVVHCGYNKFMIGLWTSVSTESLIFHMINLLEFTSIYFDVRKTIPGRIDASNFLPWPVINSFVSSSFLSVETWQRFGMQLFLL